MVRPQSLIHDYVLVTKLKHRPTVVGLVFFALLPVAALMIGIDKGLNLIVLVLLSLLFVGCVALVSRDEHFEEVESLSVEVW